MKHLFAVVCILAAGLALLAGWFSPVSADCAVVRSRVIVQRPAVVVAAAPAVVVVKKEVAVAAVLAVPVATYIPVPIYAGYYQPPVYPPTGAVPGGATPNPASAPGSEMSAVLNALERISRRLDALEGRTPTPARAPGEPVPIPAKSPTAGKVPTVFGAKCAQCHQRGREKDGGDFILLEADGLLAKLTDRQVGRVALKIATSKMPPKVDKAGKPLTPVTDEEAAEAAEFLESLK